MQSGRRRNSSHYFRLFYCNKNKIQIRMLINSGPVEASGSDPSTSSNAQAPQQLPALPELWRPALPHLQCSLPPLLQAVNFWPSSKTLSECPVLWKECSHFFPQTDFLPSPRLPLEIPGSQSQKSVPQVAQASLSPQNQ